MLESWSRKTDDDHQIFWWFLGPPNPILWHQERNSHQNFLAARGRRTEWRSRKLLRPIQSDTKIVLLEVFALKIITPQQPPFAEDTLMHSAQGDAPAQASASPVGELHQRCSKQSFPLPRLGKSVEQFRDKKQLNSNGLRAVIEAKT